MLVVLAALVAAPAARAEDPFALTTVKLGGIDGSGTEPRITVAPDDTRYAITSTKRSGGSTVVFKSADQGASWTKTAGDPVQADATIDVDVVAMPTGRILASELDEAGLNFPSSYSDDGGATWTEARGSTRLADQDRQWFAVGPDTDKDGKPNVYLLYHNLGSGTANHNMFVATSTDGGATFGPPVPTTVPGQTAYADLQCADSGGPSDIQVNPDTGRIYVFFTTRAGTQVIPGQDFGGCAAMPLEFNIVNATRVWVASSPSGLPGTWSQSLAVDDAPTGQVVSMQLAYGALDNRGGVYVAYPESPKQYPELGGAAVKLVWQDPDAGGNLTDGKWSAPVTLVPTSDPASGGTNLVHLMAGDPGHIAVAYYRGVPMPGQSKPIWFTRLLHSPDVRAASPEIVDQLVSDVPTHKWTASEMMGVCADPTPVQGIENGVACDRSTDVWGVALDRRCRVSVVWPTAGTEQDGATKDVPGSAPGTYVTTQTGGPTLCPSGRPPAAGAFLPSAPAAQAGCHDDLIPTASVVGRVRASRRGLVIRGRAQDRGCRRARAKVAAVDVAVARRVRRRCAFLRGNGRLGRPSSCRRRTFLAATGGSRWKLAVRGALPRGRYTARARVTDAAGNVGTTRSVRFKVRH
jgi:BNR repeat-like domain